MSMQHPNLKAELLYLIGRAGAPLSSAELYEKSELAEEIASVSKGIANLQYEGKIARVPGEGRARYALADGVKAPAPAGKNGRTKAAQAGDAAGAEVLPDAPLQAAAEPAPAAAQRPEPAALPAAAKPAGAKPAQADAGLADAIIARLKRDLAPLFGKPLLSDLEITTAPGAIHVNVDRVEINISIGGGA